jgi:orotidine-5'-phosphate decarboxylase
MNRSSEIAIAFDVPALEEALALDRALGDGPELAKVGLELFASAGPDAVRALRDRGRRVFLDLKLHDIPNTVRGAAAAEGRTGAELVTVHGLGGEAMIAAAVEGAKQSSTATRIVVVTLLTSLDPADPPAGLERPLSVDRVAAEILASAERAGALGIVCSARDLPGIQALHPEPFFAVTPGIRPAGSPSHDQQRVATIAEAAAAGASLVVLGRAITSARSPREALEIAREQLRSTHAAGRSTGLPSA